MDTQMQAAMTGTPAPAVAAPSPAPSSSGKTEIAVPVSALAIANDAGGDTNPEAGDAVSFQGEGKVVSVTGGLALVAVDTINGQAVGSENQEEDLEAEGEALRASLGAGGGGGY